MANPGIGQHLIIHGHTSEIITSRSTMAGFIFDVVKPDGIGMTLVGGPFIFRVNNGLHAHAVIAESHITVDCWTDANIAINVFSCKPFPIAPIIKLAALRFGLQPDYQQVILPRAGTA